MNVTVGHSCILKGTTVEGYNLIGIKSILEEYSYMEKNSVLAAGSVLKRDTRIPSGQLWAGNPAKYLRDLTHEEIEFLTHSADNYKKNAVLHKEEFPPTENQWREAEALGFGDIIGYKKMDF